MKTTIGFHGDLDAPIGSYDWALAMREEIRSSYSLAMLHVLEDRVRAMDKSGGWNALKNKQTDHSRA